MLDVTKNDENKFVSEGDLRERGREIKAREVERSK